METYIALYDILGFKEFTFNSQGREYTRRHFGHIFRESQNAVSKGNYIDGRHPGTRVPDLSFAEVNCMHISDCIIFWTVGGITPENFKKIVDVCYDFNWRCLQAAFPIRGCLVKGDIEFEPYEIPIKNGVKFINSSLYGRGLTEAYLKSESQDWSGSYIDKSAIASVDDKTVCDLIYANKLVYYPVPLKDGTFSYEHTFRIMGPLNNVAFRNHAISIEKLFSQHMNNKPLPDSVKNKLNNTLKFLEYFRNETPTVAEEKKAT